jgi:transposase-like protein
MNRLLFNFLHNPLSGVGGRALQEFTECCSESRRRWFLQDKLQMVRESYEPGKSVSMSAGRHEVNPNQLFQWRKLHQAGALSAVSLG